MTFELNTVVPWGRSFGEYERMFALTDDDLKGRILGCADGPASFNAEAARRGGRAVSCDPLYLVNAAGIRTQIEAAYPVIMEQTRRNLPQFVWKEFTSVDDLGRKRKEAMETFLHNYTDGRKRGRYVAAELPFLPFDTGAFDLALCSHFLFLYTEQLDEDFHTAAIMEMARAAADVRIFPLSAMEGIRSRHVSPVAHRLEESGLDVRIERVPYEYVMGANEMMHVLGNARR